MTKPSLPSNNSAQATVPILPTLEGGTSSRKCRFNKVAWFYELLSSVYSTGQIAASKAWQVNQLQPQERVLYVGVGAGEDALLAADRDIDLTCIDLSERMLQQTAKKLARYGHQAQLLCQDVREHQRWGHYDVVAANYFLNCFQREEMIAMLHHLTALVRPGGRLMIADVAPARGNIVSRAVHETHHAIAIRSFHALGLVPLHPIYDYELYLAPAGLGVELKAGFRLAGIGPVSYQSLICRKRAHAAKAVA